MDKHCNEALLGSVQRHFSLSSGVSGNGLPCVSGSRSANMNVKSAENANMEIGIAGEMSARVPTVVAKTPPTLAIIEADPTPAFLTVVGINSVVHIQSIANEEEMQKLAIRFRMTIGMSS